MKYSNENNNKNPVPEEPAPAVVSRGRNQGPVPESFNQGKEVIAIDGVRLTLSHPDKTDSKWIGQGEILKQILACWLIVDKKDFPLSPRITGTPGIGKTTLAMAAAHFNDLFRRITRATRSMQHQVQVFHPSY